MSLCLYSRKSVNSLSRLIFKISTRNKVNYPTVRMSDLCDELYKVPWTNPNQSSESDMENNNQIDFNENTELEKKKKRIIIKIKITDKQSNGGESESFVFNKVLNGEYSCSDTFLRHFESKTPGRIYTLELIDCTKATPELDYKNNYLIEDTKESDEKDSETVSIVHKNIKISIKLRYEHNQNKINDAKDSCKAGCKDISLNNEIKLMENLSVTLEELDKMDCIPNTQEKPDGIKIGNTEDNNCIDTEENKANYKDETEESVELFGHREAKNTHNKEVANEISKITSFKKAEVDNSGECYVIDINIPKESNVEDETIYIYNREERKNINTFEINDISPGINEIENYEGNSRITESIHNTKADNITENALNYKKSSNKKSKKQEKYMINAHTIKQNKVTNPSVESLSKQKKKDSLIISDIVMKKYGETLTQFNERSRQRKQIRLWQSLCDNPDKTGSQKKFNRPMSLDINHLNHNENFFPLRNKTPDSGLESTQELDSSNCKSSGTSNQSFKYSPTVFLKQALGDEYMYLTCDSEQDISKNGYSTPVPVPYNGRSIGSSEISTLMSTTGGVESLYSTIDKSKKKKSTGLKNTSVKRPLFNSTYTSSDPYPYESIENFQIDYKSEELNKSISLQCEIIAQVSKALNLCRQSPKFFGSEPHLEAEKYLLFSTYKKTILEKQLNRDYEEIKSEQSYATVNIENLRFTLNTGNGPESTNIDQYYLCLLHSNATLLASNIVVAEKNGHIIFKQSFQFDNLTSDFEIYLKIFSLTLKNKKALYCSPLKRNSSWRSGRINNTEKLTEMSAFQLLGTSKLDASDLYKSNSLYLEKVFPNGRLSDGIAVDIKTSIKITNNLRGFLTIGTNTILWNRRWCVLEGPFLKYWNFPSDEHGTTPIKIFDLSNCTSRQVTIVDKTVCSRPRTLVLQIHSEEHGTMQYFLQADNSVELKEWKKHLNSVLISLNNWKCLKYTN